MIDRVSLVAYPDGVSVFFDREYGTNAYHQIGDKSINRVQHLAYWLVEAGRASIYPGPTSPLVRWTIEIKDKS